MKPKYRKLAIALMLTITITFSGAVNLLRADTGACNGTSFTLPFLDVAGNGFFCQIAAAYFSGLTNGTTPTTYSPNDAVPRAQMAAFVTRTLDQSLKRGSRRAALNQWWTSSSIGTGMTTVGNSPRSVASDGADLWVANYDSGTVSRVRGSDGKLLGNWTGATNAASVQVARGRIFVTGKTSPGSLYVIDPTQPAGAVTILSSTLGAFSEGMTFDGARIWTADTAGGSVSKVDPASGATQVIAGFTTPFGILYDGANVWVADFGDDKLKKLDSNGAVVGNPILVGDGPCKPVFDGANIWVPNANSGTVTVVRAATSTVLATLSGNGLFSPVSATFDGERILVTNLNHGHVSLWKAADLTPIPGSPLAVGSSDGACSDGLNFWITLRNADKLARL